MYCSVFGHSALHTGALDAACAGRGLWGGDVRIEGAVLGSFLKDQLCWRSISSCRVARTLKSQTHQTSWLRRVGVVVVVEARLAMGLLLAGRYCVSRNGDPVHYASLMMSDMAV